MNKFIFASVLLTLLTACSQHNTTPPKQDLFPVVPPQWNTHSLSATEVLQQPHWWTAFHDPALDKVNYSPLKRSSFQANLSGQLFFFDASLSTAG